MVDPWWHPQALVCFCPDNMALTGGKPACSSDSEWLGLTSGATVGIQSESGVSPW